MDLKLTVNYFTSKTENKIEVGVKWNNEARNKIRMAMRWPPDPTKPVPPFPFYQLLTSIFRVDRFLRWVPPGPHIVAGCSLDTSHASFLSSPPVPLYGTVATLSLRHVSIHMPTSYNPFFFLFFWAGWGFDGRSKPSMDGCF